MKMNIPLPFQPSRLTIFPCFSASIACPNVWFVIIFLFAGVFSEHSSLERIANYWQSKLGSALGFEDADGFVEAVAGFAEIADEIAFEAEAVFDGVGAAGIDEGGAAALHALFKIPGGDGAGVVGRGLRVWCFCF